MLESIPLLSVMCRDYSKTYARSKYYDEAKPWNERCDIAFPCASQNEIEQSDAFNLVNSGCRILVEGNYCDSTNFVLLMLQFNFTDYYLSFADARF